MDDIQEHKWALVEKLSNAGIDAWVLWEKTSDRRFQQLYEDLAGWQNRFTKELHGEANNG